MRAQSAPEEPAGPAPSRPASATVTRRSASSTRWRVCVWPPARFDRAVPRCSFVGRIRSSRTTTVMPSSSVNCSSTAGRPLSSCALRPSRRDSTWPGRSIACCSTSACPTPTASMGSGASTRSCPTTSPSSCSPGCRSRQGHRRARTGSPGLPGQGRGRRADVGPGHPLRHRAAADGSRQPPAAQRATAGGREPAPGTRLVAHPRSVGVPGRRHHVVPAGWGRRPPRRRLLRCRGRARRHGAGRDR